MTAPRIAPGTAPLETPRAAGSAVPPRAAPVFPDLVPGHEVRLLPDGALAFPRMIEAIRGATRFVLVEMYCFAADVVGRRFARELVARAAAGVDVRVMYDSAGCRATPRGFFGWMRQRGVRVLEVNPLRRFLTGLPLRWRDHRKLLVIDGVAAFVGGLNLSRHYAPPEQGGLGWRDTAIEIRGPAVPELTAGALDLWSREGGLPGRDSSLLRPAPAGDASPGVHALVLGSPGVGARWLFARHFRHLIHRARRRIWIANPYFLPPASIRRALRRAAARGVDVRLLVPRHSDVPPALYASQHYYARYLRWGLRLFEWTGAMMHGKVSVIDGLWGTIGSANLDPLSLRQNFEVTVLLQCPELGLHLETMFERDFAIATEVRPERWNRRSRLRRTLEGFCSLFRLLL
jgi:cardiolipin synthase A/B